MSNQRNDFLITTLPVATLETGESEVLLVPHFADGGGWTTQVILVNPTNDLISGTLQFWSQGSEFKPAEPLMVDVNGQLNDSFPYLVPARSAQTFTTSGVSPVVSVGSLKVMPSVGATTPSTIEVFSFQSNGITVSEAGVQALRPAASFRMYAESSGDFSAGEIGSLQSGFALANMSTTETAVKLQLSDLSGKLMGEGTISIPGNGQVAMFLDQISGFKTLQPPLRGVLLVLSPSGSNITMVGLRARINQRGDFLITTTPPITEQRSVEAAETFFPQVVDGGGYVTQFVLVDQLVNRSSGVLQFFSQSGQPLYLRIR